MSRVPPTPSSPENEIEGKREEKKIEGKIGIRKTLDILDVVGKEQPGIGHHPRNDEPTPGTGLHCAKCGADLTGCSTVECGGKLFCARPGCGYPPRGEC